MIFVDLILKLSCLILNMVEILYRNYLKRREEKFNSRAILISEYFKKMNDFYVELKWKVKIPLLSWLCPNDIFKITKYGNSVRADYTFVDYKRLSVIRKPLSFYLKINEETKIPEIFRLDRETKQYYNFMDPLDEEEFQLVFKDIMNKQRMNGSFKILECKLEENKSFANINKFGVEKVSFHHSLTVRVCAANWQCVHPSSSVQ